MDELRDHGELAGSVVGPGKTRSREEHRDRTNALAACAHQMLGRSRGGLLSSPRRGGQSVLDVREVLGQKSLHMRKARLHAPIQLDVMDRFVQHSHGSRGGEQGHGRGGMRGGGAKCDRRRCSAVSKLFELCEAGGRRQGLADPPRAERKIFAKEPPSRYTWPADAPGDAPPGDAPHPVPPTTVTTVTAALSRSRSEARRRGRRAAMVVYYAIVAAFGVLVAGNITWQVWAPAFEPHATVACAPSLRGLAEAVNRARARASAASAGGEDAAIAAFRAALLPEWNERDAIARSCEASPKLAAALDTIERLRYAEERAVRREVADLAPLRQQVRQMMAGDFQGNP